jgi:hypothetical protein
MDQNIVVRKLDEIIAAGKGRAAKGMESLQREYGMRRDWIVKPQNVGVEIGEDHVIRPVLESGVGAVDLTKFSRGQFLSRAGFPVAFADKILDHDLTGLLQHNLKTLLPAMSKEGILFRVVDGVAKGVLSSSYKRLDASPIFESYLTAALQQGMVPHDGMVTDTRAFMSFIVPEIVEIMPGEHVVIGAELRSSDYGRGAVELCISIMRLLCQNGMIGFDLMRKIHVGRRFNQAEFGDDSIIDISARTLELDTETVRSAINDVMGGMPKYTQLLTDGLKARATEDINLPLALATLKKQGMRKSMLDNVKSLYESPLPVELVPEEPGKWRFANILSMLANKAEGDEQKDLQDQAFTVLMPSAT